MIYLLIIYIIALIAFGIYSFFGIYHLWRFGYIGDLTKPAIIIYIIIALLAIGVSITFIMFRSWPVDFNI